MCGSRIGGHCLDRRAPLFIWRTLTRCSSYLSPGSLDHSGSRPCMGFHLTLRYLTYLTVGLGMGGSVAIVVEYNLLTGFGE
uniref:Expressed protein n=2 Tax=Schizophyllum commune (strain H4-8 / FGSC 9210) TaxID=578458 RepID=D8PRN1_SCHCM